jgi:hypothetical protein
MDGANLNGVTDLGASTMGLDKSSFFRVEVMACVDFPDETLLSVTAGSRNA